MVVLSLSLFHVFCFFAVLYVHNAPLATGFMHTFTTQEPHSHEGDIVVE